MLHEAIFLATSCKKTFTCNTPFCNCNCCVASCKKSITTLYFSQRCETSCLRVTSLLQPGRFFIRHVALQVARKIASCNMALRVSWKLHHVKKRKTVASVRLCLSEHILQCWCYFLPPQPQAMTVLSLNYLTKYRQPRVTSDTITMEGAVKNNHRNRRV